MGKRITIQGKVHNVGYRLFLLEQADTMFIPHFDAKNTKIDDKEALIVLEERFTRLENEISKVKMALVKAGIKI